VKEHARAQWAAYERERYLSTIDSLWKNHLYAMDHLKEGVYLEAYAQKDPKVIYKKEGYELFKQLFDLINQSLVEVLFRVEVQGELDVERIRRLRRQVSMHYGRGVEGQEGEQPAQGAGVHNVVQPRPSKEVGRNDPCPCGSGKKYKKCCLPKHLGGEVGP
jgi:preprotein translocase subunit SecA